MHPETPPIFDQHQLDAASAYIHQQKRAAVEAERVARRLEDQARFLLTRDDFNSDAGFLEDAADKGSAILCFAHRAGGDCVHLMDFPDLEQPPEILEGAHREVHRFFGETASREGTATETDHFLDAVNHFNMPIAAYVGDEHMNGI